MTTFFVFEQSKILPLKLPDNPNELIELIIKELEMKQTEERSVLMQVCMIAEHFKPSVFEILNDIILVLTTCNINKIVHWKNLDLAILQQHTSVSTSFFI